MMQQKAKPLQILGSSRGNANVSKAMQQGGSQITLKHIALSPKYHLQH